MKIPFHLFKRCSIWPVGNNVLNWELFRVKNVGEFYRGIEASRYIAGDGRERNLKVEATSGQGVGNAISAIARRIYRVRHKAFRTDAS